MKAMRMALGVALALAACVSAGAEGGAWEAFGSSEVRATATLDQANDIGVISETTLGVEWKPADGPGFRAEGGIRFDLGQASALAAAFDAGLVPVPAEASLPPGTDLRRALQLDHAYASWSAGPLDGKFGVIPIAWGSGYVFNPEARILAPAFPDFGEGTAEGRIGALVSAAFLGAFSAEAYALAEPRIRPKAPALGEVAPERFPFGFRLLARTEVADAALTFSRSTLAAGVDPEYRVGADATGFLGPFTLYAEGSARLFPRINGVGRDFDAWKDIDACAGLSFLVPVAEITLRAEAGFLGDGADVTADYDRVAVISGTRATLGKAYVFASAEREFDDRLDIRAGALVNAVDASFACLGEIAWSPIPSLEFSLSGTWFSGGDESEFGGRMRTGPETWLDPFRPTVGLSAKASF